MPLNCYEIRMYEKTYVKMNNVLSVLSKLLKTTLKIRNSCFYEKLLFQKCRMLVVFDKPFGYLLRKAIILSIMMKT